MAVPGSQPVPQGAASRRHHLLASRSSGVAFEPEECPFESVMVDVTHRCNMACANCYLPNRTLPDMDARWLSGILARLPRPRRIRIVGAEPTVRADLPEIIAEVRRHGHVPFLLTNGLKLADRAYLRELKRAKLRSVYLSFNGGFDDDAYEIVDGQRCADAKGAALDNLCAERMFVALGMIIVRGVNEEHPRAVLDRCRRERSIFELKLRSVGPMGRYMGGAPFTLAELADILARHLGDEAGAAPAVAPGSTYLEVRGAGRLRIQLTQWPDLASSTRGRLTPEGKVEPFFEHVMANDGGY